MDLEKMTIKELTELYNSMTEGKKIKKFESRAKAIARVKKLLPEKKEHKVSKMGIIREMFQDQASWTRGEIMSRTGFDSKNAHAAMNVLKNPKRTKDPLNFTYDRENQTYKLVKVEGHGTDRG
jgi:hypothetical protein